MEQDAYAAHALLPKKQCVIVSRLLQHAGTSSVANKLQLSSHARHFVQHCHALPGFAGQVKSPLGYACSHVTIGFDTHNVSHTRSVIVAGLMASAAAKAFSASSVAITDIRPGNLPVALQLGAAHALDQSQAKSTAETVESLRAVFHEGTDIVIDCVGLSSTLTVCCVHTAMKSRCVITAC